MPDASDNRTISKKPNEGFKDYLDFDKLRSESIAYLGRLAGKIWTDHNVHDPGITTLEVLCYAILDLGYRTNLPAADIFTPGPDNKEPENNFFTPAQMLTCNPLTITDFRKLLVDIPGVNNAWLEVATDKDIGKICAPDGNNSENNCERKRSAAEVSNNDAIHYLNGLYHVYADIERVSDNITEQAEFEDIVIKQIRKALMAHRNICEDFIDITILCESKMGVCADIEIEPDVDIENIYLAVINQLREYFSPLPKFYTLENLLLEKQKTIDDVFAGRPHELKKSHGFVDTEEFENLKLVKKLHLSDVYSVLQKITGVIRINKLKFRKCDLPNLTIGWEYQLPLNHVPRLDLDCTSITFTIKGLPVVFDTKQYTDLLKLNFTQSGKFLYKAPSPYLDPEIPKGIYRSDLTQYTPIQNEFPKVYGLTEGDLPINASKLRRAQALQFRGYLLFFDQLLANYLGQLQNIRSLFSFTSGGINQRHTYFSNQINMPGLQDLITFNVQEGNSGFMGSKGSPVAFPVNKKELLDQIDKGCVNLQNLEPYSFKTMSECKVAVSQLVNDIEQDDFEFKYASNKDGCGYYYMETSFDDVAVIGKRYFGNESDAKRAAETIRYAGVFEENYRTFITPEKNFSFNLEMNLIEYSEYLQKILESEDEYLKRRKNFLDHLLLRFSEQFSEYAILAYRDSNRHDFGAQEIDHREKFLSNYDKLSSNRGKAYNYFKDGWNNGNVSGFEKRINALLNVPASGKQSLCNFEVVELQKLWVFKIKFGGGLFFASKQTFSSEEKAAEAARELVFSLGNPNHLYSEKLQNQQTWGIKARYGPKGWETDFFKDGKSEYPNQTEAYDVIKRLARTFQEDAFKRSISVDTYKYQATIKKLTGTESIYTFKNFESTSEKALEQGSSKLVDLNNTDLWNPEGLEPRPANLIVGYRHDDKIYLLDDTFLKPPDINNNRDDEPDKYYFTLAAKENAFVFDSIEGYGDPGMATEHFNHLKLLMLNDNNYRIERGETGDLHVQVWDHQKLIAQTRGFTESEAIKRLKRIKNIVGQHTYFMEPKREDDKRSFIYKVGFEPLNHYEFKSINEYRHYDHIIKEAEYFHKNPNEINIIEENQTVILENIKTHTKCRLEGQYDDIPNLIELLKKEIGIQGEIRRLMESGTAETFKKFVELDPVSKAGTYYYRLVDKNNPYAAYREDNNDKVQLATVAENAYDLFADDYNYLELQSGDVVVKTTDDRKRDWYHYQFKSRNAIRKPGQPNVKKQIVLFESVKAYKSREEAIEAYNRDFELILEKAKEAANYGDGELITLKNIFERNDFTNLFGKTLVRIPKETLDFLGDYDEKSIGQMVNVVKSYPIRTMKITDEVECFDLFPAPKPKEDECSKPCLKSQEKTVYYFVLFNKFNSREDWQSVRYYETAAQAIKAFNFFVLLMRYKGNYYIDCDCSGKFRIFVREVLAEGVERFEDESKAWGKDGVLNFICTVQSKNSFHFHVSQIEKKCCYSFDIGCIKLTHPIRYDLPEIRDKALSRIHEKWTRYAVGDLKLEENLIKNSENVIIAEIVRKPDAKDGNICNYAVEIAPGRDNSFGGKNDDDDYGPDLITEYCYINPENAFEHFNNDFRSLLENIGNYKPVFDCTCGSYGIDFYERIAYNPQCYPNTELACEAAKRAVTLTNTEGLHFVEHILLRPETSQDCINRIPACCDEFDGCRFIWTEETDDVCETEKPVWFLPGYDPYSFIATAVMPVWSKRFRRKENRLMMEDLLRREVPAHVMLRVLWLSPYDLCVFERSYRKWGHWLGGSDCGNDFNMYEFIELLFKAGFECLDDDCDCCECCKEKDDMQQGCFSSSDNHKNLPLEGFSEQIDELYCWTPSTCPRPPYDDKQKRKIIKQRQNKYQDSAVEIEGRTQSERAARVKAFTKNPAPTVEKFKEVLSHLMSTPEKGSSEPKLEAKDLRRLTEITVHHYLDSITMKPQKYGDQYLQQFSKLKDAMAHVKTNVTYHSEIYRKWKYDEVVRVNPGLDFLKHKHIMA